MADMLADVTDAQALFPGTTVDTTQATLLIECATAVIQASVGQRLVRVVDDPFVIDLDEYDHGTFLYLPERPVISVASVSVGALVVTDFTTQLAMGRLWRSMRWRSSTLQYCDQPSTVSGVYTHGYASGDQNLQLARAGVLGLIRGAVGNPGGLTSVKIDDYAATYGRMAGFLESSKFLLAALRRKYRRPLPSTRLIASG